MRFNANRTFWVANNILDREGERMRVSVRETECYRVLLGGFYVHASSDAAASSAPRDTCHLSCN